MAQGENVMKKFTITFIMMALAFILSAGTAYGGVTQFQFGDDHDIECSEIGANNYDCTMTIEGIQPGYLSFLGLPHVSGVPVFEYSTKTFFVYSNDGTQISQADISCDIVGSTVECDLPMSTLFDINGKVKAGVQNGHVAVVISYTHESTTLDFETGMVSLYYLSVELGPDSDGDDVSDLIDNCPTQYNPSQSDNDGDNYGDWCDNCMMVSNEDQLDSDDDGIGDACKKDYDGDGITDKEDNCPYVSNADQANEDNDLRGDACDTPSNAGGNVTPTPTNNRYAGYSDGCTLVGSQAAGQGSLLIALMLAIPGVITSLTRRKYLQK
ncbi:MAG: hypothetical protein HN337_03700 [Deltaproteobacteria bacterium]|jgi:hypothetical protein|nr:hypothetical protein [Deltaproteobacteria bacterium]